MGGEANGQNSAWTPELVIQAFKEFVTAVLGIIVVGYTIYFAVETLGYVGQDKHMTDAKDILMLMLGVAGVVIGYYFGRIPGDARAAQAQVDAHDAAARTEKVNAQAQIAVSRVEQILDQMPAAEARGAEEQHAELFSMSSNLQKVRDELRSLVTASQTLK